MIQTNINYRYTSAPCGLEHCSCYVLMITKGLA
ncbi:hypothetical protein ACQ27_gp464 [Klebsiella phage K64-1]|nr:hypothetical protein ACQ27_gp464 [Klebsiella phage K64-1]